MRAALGILGIALGAGASAIGVFLLAMGIARQNQELVRAGRRCAFVVLAAALLAVGAMEWALLTHDFSIKYVAENNARSTPLLFTITGLWAALEGSILLWVLILAGYIAVMARRFRSRLEDPMVAWALLVALTVACFFFVFMAVAANPFQVIDGTIPVDGRGPNPLLQNHPLMAFHPPMLYLGYVGFTVPFAFAMAALITGRFGEGWLTDTRRTTLVAWGFLTVGIVLGAWWSYEVLGWGGYWGWDPVENASLLPWLTGTAFIHSVIVQERRGMLRVWNLSLVLATFCLTILGTFLTRSGVVNSVHAFTQSSIGPWLLGFLAVVVVTCLALIAWRADKLHAPGRIDSPVSREAAFMANNLLFTGLAFVVLLGTVFPLVAEAVRGNQLAVGEPYFARMTTPIGLALLFLMAVAPALPWRAASGEVLRRRLIVPAYAGVVAMLLTLVFLTRTLATVLAFGLATFAIVAIVRETTLAVRTRRVADRTGWFRSFTGTVRGNPRRYGGFIVHIGVICIAVALASAGSFGTKQEVRLRRGESVEVGGYRVKFVDTRTSRTGQKTSVSADLALSKDGRSLGTYAPAVSTFPNSNSAIGTPSVRTGILEDVYLTIVSSPNEQGRVTVGIAVNSMTLWIWVGGGLMALGTIVAIGPTVRRRLRVQAATPEPPVPTDPLRATPDPSEETEGVGV
jgi:cytochrome c-type biogenesis protein CcmF